MDENVKPIRSRESLRKQVEAEVTEARVKEAKGKMKKLIEERMSIQSLLRKKDEEIEGLFDEYSEVLPG